MYTFKQFLNEKWGRGMPGFPGLGMFKKSVHHSATVKGHDVQVVFTPHNAGHTNVDFVVNGRFLKHKGDEPDHGHEVLKHVHGVVDKYIKKKKPKAIGIYANHPKKHAAYKAYAHMLAKRYNGHARELGLRTGMYHVELNHGKEPDR